MAALTSAWQRFWFGRPTSPENLGLIRMAVGSGLIALHITNFYSLVTVDLAGPRFHFLEPIWYFRLLGIEQVSPLLTMIVFATVIVSTVAIILGYKTRTAILVTILCIFFLKGVRDSAAGDVHHRYLMWVHALVFLLASRAGDVLSLDRRRAVATGGARPIEGWETSWPIRAMQAYVAIFYCGSAIAKLRVAGGDWLFDGTAVQKILLEKSARWGFEMFATGQGLAQFPTLAWGLVLFTILMELGFPTVLFISTMPRLAFLMMMAGFHIANGVLLGVNFYLTPLLYVVFFDLSRLRDWWGRAPLAAPLPPSPG